MTGSGAGPVGPEGERPTSDATAPPSGSGPRRGLPSPDLTSFRGRRAEVEAVEARLRAARLVTVVGPGGAGKSRLAREVVGRLDHEDVSVGLVELSPVNDPTLVPALVASALGLRLSGGQNARAALVEHLRRGRWLLVVDNCEHLVAPVGALVTDLLPACPGLEVLATSRSPLSVRGEHLVRLPALAPSDAAALFADRAGARGWLATEPGDAAHVAELCRRVEGLPLAIEIAAGWTAAMTLPELVEAHGDQAALLAQVDPSAPHGDRHRSLGAVLGWSYQLLEPFERDALDRLSVLAERFDPPVAESVLGMAGGPTLDVLRSLVERSLVMMERWGDRSLFRLHGIVRAFAGLRLDATAGARTAALVRLGNHLRDRFEDRPDDGHWLAEIESCYGTVTTAVDDLLPLEPQLAARLMMLVSRYLRARRNLGVGIDQLMGWASRLPPSTEARDVIGQISLDLSMLCRPAMARRWCDQHEAMTNALGEAAPHPLRPTPALRAVVALLEEDPVTVRDLCRSLLAGDGPTGWPLSPRAEMEVAWTLGVAQHLLGDLDQSEALARQALDAATRLGDLTSVQELASNLVHARAVRTGRAAQAGNYLRWLDLPHYQGEASGVPPLVEAAAWVAFEIGHLDDAARLGRLLGASPPIGFVFEKGARPEDLARAVAKADPGAWTRATDAPMLSVGDALTLSRAVLSDPDLPPLDEPIELGPGPDSSGSLLAAPAPGPAAADGGSAADHDPGPLPERGLLAHLSPAGRRELMARADRRRYPRGSVLLRQGEPGAAVHLLLSGWVGHQMVTAAGETATVDVVGPGELVGDLGLVDPGPPRAVRAVALGPVETIALHRWDLDELRRRHPGLQEAVMARLVAQVERLSGSLTDALYLPVDHRVLRRLADLCVVYGQAGPAPAGTGGPIEIPLTQDVLATMVGTTRSTVNRVLRRAESAGHLRLARGRIVVIDVEALRLIG